MTVTFKGTNELETLTAEKNVVIQEEDSRFTGGRAFYTHTNTTLEITQDPQWRSGLRQGKGKLLRVNTQKNEMLVRGDASMRLPAREMAGQLAPSTVRMATNQPPQTSTNEFAEIYCEEYTLRQDNSVFLGGVYATHPEMNWSCEKMTVQVPGTGTTNLIAEQNVVFGLMTQKGEIHGKGDRAVYSFGALRSGTNAGAIINELRLTGAPAFLNSTNGTFENPLIIWDRARDKLILPGGAYRIQGLAKAGGTNIFVLPNKKRAK
jgi:lipopolysaccharide export system protein LptA